MKVILLDDVKKIGKRYEIKDVKSGFARNFLIPQKKAMPATDKNLAQFEKKKSEQDEKQKLQEELLLKNLEELKNIKVTIAAPANEEGHLYAQVDKKDIAEALSEQAHIELAEDYIQLEKPLKEIGVFEVKVSIGESEGSLQLGIEKGGSK